MFGVVLVLAGLSSPAGAQMPPGFGTSLGMPTANARYIIADVVSKRFPGEDVVGPTFTTGEQVDVIIEDGGSVRIRQGERYGWVPAGQLTSMSPMPQMPMPGMPQMPGANPLLGGLKPLVPAPPGTPVPGPKTP
jgi:hypothetical protein